MIRYPNNRFETRFPALRRLALYGLAAAALVLSGCIADTGTMRNQPRLDPMEPSAFFVDGRSARSFPAGTVPQTDGPVGGPEQTGLGEDGQPFQGFPVEVTGALVERGRERFTIYCSVCHGDDAQGQGRVVPFGMPQPPNLLDETYRTMPEGQIFDVITHGKGNMFPYGYRVKAPDRWAVIAYLRALQLKNGPYEGELSAEELQQLGVQP